MAAALINYGRGIEQFVNVILNKTCGNSDRKY
jgi:hypothetical protein